MHRPFYKKVLAGLLLAGLVVQIQWFGLARPQFQRLKNRYRYEERAQAFHHWLQEDDSPRSREAVTRELRLLGEWESRRDWLAMAVILLQALGVAAIINRLSSGRGRSSPCAAASEQAEG